MVELFLIVMTRGDRGAWCGRGFTVLRRQLYEAYFLRWRSIKFLESSLKSVQIACFPESSLALRVWYHYDVESSTVIGTNECTMDEVYTLFFLRAVFGHKNICTLSISVFSVSVAL
jgi:hypothetical protein